MKNNYAQPGASSVATGLLSLLLGIFFSINSYGQFTTTWPLTANQTFTTTGADAANVVGTNQVMSSTLFIPAANQYIGVTSGTAGDGQRSSPKLNDGNDGGWIIDGAAVEGRFEEFAVSPASGFNLTIDDISFYIGNRSSSNLRASAYYYVGATNAGFTLGTGTALGLGIRPGSSSNQWVQFSYSALNIAVPAGSKIFVRIYPYMTGSATTGKYFCTKQVVVSGITTSPNISNIQLNTPVTCATDRLNISWTGPGGYNPATTTLLAFLKQTNPVTIGTPSNTLASYTANTVFPLGTGYQNDALLAKCIYKGTGTDAFGNHSGLLVTGLTAGATYQLLIFVVTNATSTYTPPTGATGSGATLAAVLPEPGNHVTVFAKGVLSTSNIPLTWTAAAGPQLPQGYLLQASNIGTPADPADASDLSNQTDITAGTANFKVTPNTATGYNAFTGFAAGTMYYFRVNSYTNAGACINYKPVGPVINAATLPNIATVPSMAIAGANATISWTQAAGYDNTNHTTLVFVKSGSAAAAGTPTTNPASYMPNLTIGSGTGYLPDLAATCVYNGDGTSVTVNGIVSGTYHVLILTVMSSPNSDGTYSYSAYSTTSASLGTAYTWQGGGAGAWNTAANWNPTRTTPATTDILIFNNGITVAPTSIQTQTIAQLIVTNNTILNLTALSRTLTITSNNGLLNADFIVDAGSSVSLTTIMSIVLSSNSSATIAGNLNVNGGCTFNTTNAGCFTTVSGKIRNLGNVLCTAANMQVTGTGTYEHAINGGTIPTATWSAGSTCLVNGITSATTLNGHRQAFSKFIWDCAAQTANPFILGSATTSPGVVPPVIEVNDSFIVKRTNGRTLQITSSSGQRDMTCGTYCQYGGIVAITYNTNAAGGQRSLTVNNNFYVNDSLESNSKFQIVSTANSDNTNGRLYIAGNVLMRVTNASTVALEKIGTSSNAQLWFTGAADQQADFSTVTGAVDLVTSQGAATNNVFLNTDVTAARFLLTNGIFNIGANTLTITDAVSYPSPGTGTVGGTSSSNLTLALNGNAGVLNFATGKRLLKNFTQLAGNTVALGTELGISAGAAAGRDSLGSGAVLFTNDNLVLRSDAGGTARMAQLPVDGSGVALATITGTVTVERHLPMNNTYDSRRWRLLTAPLKTTGSPTINAAWQEGVFNVNRALPVNPRPGYGTQITRSTVAANGFDQGTTNNASIYYYSAGSWVAPANTNTVKITDNNACYMLFARGDRSIIVSSPYTAAAPTTLAPKGQLNTGNVTIPLAASGFQVVGNPYASQIKLDNIAFNDTLGKLKTIYLWDPKTLGSFNVGKFITCSGDGGTPATYTYTANTSGYSSDGVIESSGAFMVNGNGGNIVFHESDKTISSSSTGMASRPATVHSSLGKIRKLYTDLLSVRNSVPVLADGVANTYNRNYVNELDHFDAAKFTSFNSKEEISILRGDVQLGIERRKQVEGTDTIFLSLARLNQQTYQLRFRPESFDASFTAMLEDNYLHRSTPISLSGESSISFAVTGNEASAAANRFHIIFSKEVVDQKVVLTATNAQYGAQLQWTNNDADDINEHELQYAADGIHFTTIASKGPAYELDGQLVYDWEEGKLLPGNHYYRIRYRDETGNYRFSNVARLDRGTEKGIASVNPNPVINGDVNLFMGNLATGTYNARVTNSLGQVIFTKQLNHQVVNSVHKLKLPTSAKAGMYQLELTAVTGTKTVLQLLIK